MYLFLTGVLAGFSAIVGLFFLRFWWRLGDRLFLYFALAFWIMALNRLGLALSGDGIAPDALYWIRALAFAILIVGIVGKNLSGRKTSEPAEQALAGKE
jgi:hypothetical protein